MNAFATAELQSMTAIPDGSSSPDFPLEVLSDIVVIEQATEEKTRSGIVLVGNEQKLPCGRVVAVGPGRIYTTELNASGSTAIAHFVPTKVKVGDFVLFSRFQTGEPIEHNGKRYIMAREGDLAGYSKTGEPVSLRLAQVG